MALIEVLHVAADMFLVDPDWTNDILEGQWVSLTTVSGTVYAQRADGSADRIIGIAGDTQSNTTAATPYSAAVTINSAGATRQTENRVSDFFNETIASGKITVYHSGGTFWTDRLRAGVTFAAGQQIFVDANGNTTNANAGNGQVTGVCLQGITAYPSGVPGTDTPDGSISLGNYVKLRLNIDS